MLEALGSLLGILTGLVVLGLGALTAYTLLNIARHDLLTWWAALASDNWSTASGKIETVRVEVNGVGRRVSYDVQVRYSYMVAGQRYENTRWRFVSAWDESYVIRSDAERAAEPFQPPRLATVYYDPAHPNRATLLRDRPPLAPWQWLMTLGLLGVSALMLWVGWNVMWEAVLELL